MTDVPDGSGELLLRCRLEELLRGWENARIEFECSLLHNDKIAAKVVAHMIRQLDAVCDAKEADPAFSAKTATGKRRAKKRGAR